MGNSNFTAGSFDAKQIKGESTPIISYNTTAAVSK